MPTDVSNKRGLGYDILSKHQNGGVRHIEVKTRCSFTGVQLTPNEEKARLNDPNYIIHIHVVDGQECHTRIIKNSAEVKTKRETVFTLPNSEIDRCGVEYLEGTDSIK